MMKKLNMSVLKVIAEILLSLLKNLSTLVQTVAIASLQAFGLVVIAIAGFVFCYLSSSEYRADSFIAGIQAYLNSVNFSADQLIILAAIIWAFGTIIITLHLYDQHTSARRNSIKGIR